MTTSVRATEVRFDDAQMWVELEDGRILNIPLASYPRLLHGSAEDRAKVSISPSGLLAGRGDITRARKRAA